MRLHLAYGRTGLDVEIPDRNLVKSLAMSAVEPVADADSLIRECLARPIGTPPISELAQGCTSACIAVCDVTRPVPNAAILTPLLAQIEAAGIEREQILILIATGLHRPNEGHELIEMLGHDIVEKYRIENHRGQELSEHVFLGKSPRGVPVWIDRRYLDADFKVTVGLIEPHFMAGFSGGRKVICPGLAALETVRVWHGPDFLENPNAIVGCLDGNPVHEENTWIARHAGCDFIVNVVLDERRRVLAAFAGDMEAAFHEGVQFARSMVVDTVPRPVDVVITTGAGYPLDATYYQSVKGMVAAASIVKQGGTIILAAGMEEGIGSPEFQAIFDENPTFEGFMERLLSKKYFRMDQWQLEQFAKARRKARLRVVTGGLSPEQLGRLYVESAPSVEAALADAFAEYGPDATVAVMPKGPYVLAQAVSP